MDEPVGHVDGRAAGFAEAFQFRPFFGPKDLVDMHGFPSRAAAAPSSVTRLSSCRFTWPISLATLAGVQHQRGAQACLLEFSGPPRSSPVSAWPHRLLQRPRCTSCTSTICTAASSRSTASIRPVRPRMMRQAECFGGVARIAAAVNQLRSELEAAGENVIVLDAGDQYQGSLFFTTYRGAAAGEFMEAIGFDAMGAWQSRVQQRPRGPACRCSMRSASRSVSGNLDVQPGPHAERAGG